MPYIVLPMVFNLRYPKTNIGLLLVDYLEK